MQDTVLFAGLIAADPALATAFSAGGRINSLAGLRLFHKRKSGAVTRVAFRFVKQSFALCI
jgi:hypothetical protein